MHHNLQRAKHVIHKPALKCSEKSKTAALLTFASWFDTSVNISAAGSHQEQLLVQPACRPRQTLPYQTTLVAFSRFFGSGFWIRRKWPYYHCKESWDFLRAEEKVRSPIDPWANPNKSHFICTFIKGLEKAAYLNLSWGETNRLANNWGNLPFSP